MLWWAEEPYIDLPHLHRYFTPKRPSLALAFRGRTCSMDVHTMAWVRKKHRS